MSIALTEIKRIASLSRLKLDDEEAAMYASQLSKVLDYVNVLEGHDLTGVEPSAHAIPVFDVWREDAAAASFTAEQALANAPRKVQDQFVIGKVVE